MLVPLLAGCSTPAPPPPPAPASALIHVVDLDGHAVPYAAVAVRHGSTTVLVFSADKDGTLSRDLVSDAATRVRVAKHGYLQEEFQGGQLGAVVTLPPAPDGLSSELNRAGILAFDPPVDLLCTQPDQVPGQAECGQFGEPVVEVAGDGAIWASATCCIGKAPPIWTSRDHGKTFQQLRNPDTGLVRDSFGIEGDFAMDDVGNVYFFDISAATIWFTSYKADGTHRWTVPWAGPPLVDRPWVRAGAENHVWLFYNTGSATNEYASVDGGMTWSPTPVHSFPLCLGNPGQGPARDDLYLAAACGDKLMVWTSHDGGVTWDAGDEVPMPDVPYSETNGRGIEVMNPSTADEAGNLYVPFTHFVDAKNAQNAVFMARRDAAGNWSVPAQVSPAGMNHLPWPAAGRAGHVGFAWYFSEGTFTREQDADWRLWAAASVDADAGSPHYQITVVDPTILQHGGFGRSLGDFIEADLTPDGKIVIVYAKRVEGNLVNVFAQTDGMLELTPQVFRNGPHPNK